MPWIGVRDGETVVPEEVADETGVECPACNDELRPRGPTEDGRARHFFHLTDPCPGSTGGESDHHRKLKSLAVSRLKQVYDADERERCRPEVAVETPGDGPDRRADALVEFVDDHPTLGHGLIAEVQYRNEQKDVAAVEADYLARGYSVVWLDESDFAEDRCLLDRDALESRATTIFPDALPADHPPDPDPHDADQLLADVRDRVAVEVEAEVVFPRGLLTDHRDALRDYWRAGRADYDLVYKLREGNAPRTCARCGDDADFYILTFGIISEYRCADHFDEQEHEHEQDADPAASL